MQQDPWLIGGGALLVVLSVGVLALYRSAPQTLEQARNQTLLVARPDAHAPRLAAAEERLRVAETAAESGRDSLALAAFAEAAAFAEEANRLAEDEAGRRASTDLWARALLGSAERLQQAGTGTGLRPDDRLLLERALGLVERVLAASPSPDLIDTAETMRDEIRTQIRIGPLEWLPLPR